MSDFGSDYDIIRELENELDEVKKSKEYHDVEERHDHASDGFVAKPELKTFKIRIGVKDYETTITAYSEDEALIEAGYEFADLGVEELLNGMVEVI